MRTDASAGGGLLLGFHLPARARAGAAAPYTTHAAENPEINAWLVIEPDDTIIMRVAQAEMGQGVLTSMPMLVAEELEVDWSRVRAEYADPARHVQNDGVYRRMQTGGSAAVRKSREFRQLAGAEARERLIKAAAELWLVNPEDCPRTMARSTTMRRGFRSTTALSRPPPRTCASRTSRSSRRRILGS